MKVTLLLSLAAACCVAPVPGFVLIQQPNSFAYTAVAGQQPNSFAYAAANSFANVYDPRQQPIRYITGYVAPNTIFPFQQSIGQPQVVSYSAPVAYSAAAVEPGYVARTKGVTHRAALPEGLGYASHHINLQDAPGT